MTALQQLNALAAQRKAERSPNFPVKYITRSEYDDRDANGLTRCVVDWFAFNIHFSTRLASTGTYRYRVELQKFVGSQQRAGLPYVFAVVEGRAVFVEVKHGKDRLSDVQEVMIADLQRTGACVYIADTFEGFYHWFTAEFLTQPI